eukprot:6311837-Ditylum_brightwellii.AAC.1
MNILPPATSAATKKRRVPHKQTQNNFNFVDIDKEGEADVVLSTFVTDGNHSGFKVCIGFMIDWTQGDELKVAQWKLMVTQQNLKNVEKQKGMVSNKILIPEP